MILSDMKRRKFTNEEKVKILEEASTASLETPFICDENKHNTVNRFTSI